MVQCGQIVVKLFQVGLEVLVVHAAALVVVTVTVCVALSVIVWVSHTVEGWAHDYRNSISTSSFRNDLTAL